MFFERRIRKSTTKQTKTKLCSAFQKGLKESSYFCFLAEMETPSKMTRHSWRRCGAEDKTKYICLLFLFFVPVKSLVVDGLFRAQTDLALWSKYGYTYVLCRAQLTLQCRKSMMDFILSCGQRLYSVQFFSTLYRELQ